MDIKTIICIFCGVGVFFVLPSTIYSCMVLGIFHRQRILALEKDDLSGTQYHPFADTLKEDILYVRGLSCETVWLDAPDGVKLCGRYYKGSTDKAVIFVHGFQSNSFNNFARATIDFLKDGYGVLLIDQRAHGSSGGRFTTLGCKEKDDLGLWIDYVDSREEVADVIVYGISMGATTVGYLSDEIRSEKVKGLIMEAGFTCFYEELSNSLGKAFMKQAAMNYIYLAAKSFLRIDIKESTEDSLKRCKIPVLFLHGDDDKEVSTEFTERNFAACASEKKILTVKGAGHTLCYLVGGESLRKEIDGFINECTSKI